MTARINKKLSGEDDASPDFFEDKASMEKFDLHIHSDMSDGTLAPEDIPALAKAQGVCHIALTDHDTTAGCRRAIEGGEAIGVRVIAGIERDVEFPAELHILGLDIDPFCPAMEKFEAWRGESRRERNAAIIGRLSALGIPVEEHMEHSRGNDTRLHIAKAIIAAGYAETLSEAFGKYLAPGCAGFVPGVRPSKREAIELILESGGRPALAHPCKIRADADKLIRELADLGLWGVEAFYPASTEGQKKGFLSLCAQLGLYATCGSDFHGKNRENLIGAAYEENQALEGAWREFFGG